MSVDCSACDSSKDINRLPQGWKKHKGVVYCHRCWQERYTLRAITIPVVSPIDGDWPALRQALRPMFAAVTQLSNWLVTEMFIHDVRRDDSLDKMPPMPRMYLYPDARTRFPTLPSRTVASLEHSVGRKYRARRYEVVWACKSSLPTFRHPQPFRVPAQAWMPQLDDGIPIVSLPIGDRPRPRGHGRKCAGHL